MGYGTIVIWHLCITFCLQGVGAPFMDRCHVASGHHHYNGLAFLLHPWLRNEYGESRPQRALVFGWRI